jgi:hypothetical protein
LPVGTIHRIWRWARRYVFTEEVAASPLAGTPYDLRHAAVSTCLDGEQATMRRRVADALGLAANTPGETGKPARVVAVNLAAYLPRTAVEGR